MTTTRRCRAGFTLIEMLVVIGVIVLLAGITFTLGAGISARAARTETESTIRVLDMAMREWELRSDRKLSWYDAAYHAALGIPPEGFDVHSDTEEEFIISEVLDALVRVDGARAILAQVRPEFMYTFKAGTYPDWVGGDPDLREAVDRFDGSLTVLDAWGLPVYATHPGREWTAADATGYVLRDADGTTQTPNEHRYGVARNQTVCFVSAGPDRIFGYLNAPEGSADLTAARDNVFSYDIEKPAPAYGGDS
jgi:prepilin-type N-terminal cleavage/methylation domain-containing protein